MSARPKGWPWAALDLPKAPATTAEVRRAYAKKLKTIDQVRDIAGFSALRAAYEAALVRVDAKERKASARTAPRPADPLPADPLPAAPAPEAAEAAPGIMAPPVTSAPADPLPTPAADPPAPDHPVPDLQASAEDRLRAGLRDLFTKSIVLSQEEKAKRLLDDPAYEAAELAPILRQGMARYLHEQLLTDHRGLPYLRHPGVTTALVQALDRRFGWLSDYSAFRRDFHGNEALLEALLDRAEIERREPDRRLTATAGYDRMRLIRWLLLVYIWMALHLIQVNSDAPPGSGGRQLSLFLGWTVAIIVAFGGAHYLYQFVRARAGHRAAVLACIWAAIGALTVAIGNDMVPGIPADDLPLRLWAVASAEAAAVFFLLWLRKRLPVLLSRIWQKKG